MIQRYFGAIFIAFAITYGLIYMMSSLIDSGEAVESNAPELININPFINDEAPEVITRDLTEKPEETPPPPELNVDTSQTNLSTDNSFGLDVLVLEKPKVDTQKLEGGSDLVPIVRVAPSYPARALRRDIEGYVIVEFTVTPEGLVSGPRVVEADPEGYFEKAAIKAVERFKYNPRRVGGEAVAVSGHRERITFEIGG